jgi:uncharacterized protein DUF885
VSAVNELCRSYLDARRHLDPAEASGAGATEYDAHLGRFDADSMREHLAAYRALAAAAEELEVSDLQDEIDRTALLDDIRVALFRFEHERPHERNPEFWLSHLFQALYTLLARPGGHHAERAPAALERLKAAPRFLDAARSSLSRTPSVFIDTALGSLGGGGELVVQVTATFSEAAPGLAAELNVAAGETLAALKSFGTALNTDIRPSDDPLAFAAGEAQFERRLHHEHALRGGAPEIWRYGLHLQEEVEAEIVALAATIDPGRHWREVAERLRERGGVAEDGLLEAYRECVTGAERFIRDGGLMQVPDGPVDVVPTPPFLTALVPFAAYDPPPVELADRTGRFYVTVPAAELAPEIRRRMLRGHCAFEIPSTVVHEAYPGHHLQLLTAHALPSEVRQHLWTPLTVEGWALYCESLMAELGFFRSPESRLFHLINLLWRAVRITLDVGLHTRGMTPLEAVDKLAGTLPMERRNAEAEVRRYCAMPTYNLCYAVGRREIFKLRDDYRRHAGAAYRPESFHADLLSYGGLPVSLARWGMGL